MKMAFDALDVLSDLGPTDEAFLQIETIESQILDPAEQLKMMDVWEAFYAAGGEDPETA